MAGAPVSCENDPNFGIILSFVEQFGPLLDIGEFNIAELKSMLENSETVPQALADLHIKLMRKINKKVPAARWELALAKYAHSYSHQDAWEIERFGYKTANLAVKLRVLKALLEGQFDLNTKFKTQINTTGASELRLDPLGRDRQGNCYWYFMDETANLQIYQSDAEMETWTLVARNRDEFVNMIEMLKENRPIEPLPSGNVMEEDDESAGSASDSEALKLGSILAPSETPPSLIISRRTYKTNDKINASATIEKEVKVDITEGPNTNNMTVVGADVEMKSDELSVVAETDVGQENTPTGDTREGAGQETDTVATTAAAEVKKEANAKEMQCELDSKNEELSTEIDPPEGKNSTDEFEESNVKDKCINSTEPETIEEVHEKTKSPVAKGMDADDHEKTEPIVEKNSDEKETEERQDSPSPNEGAADDCTEKQSDDISKTSIPPEPIHATQDKKMDVEKESVSEEVAAKAIIGEPIEDPPLVVRGEGNGAECDSGIVPIFSEVIEEPMMFFYGLGAGMENGMGNTKKVEPTLTVPGGATTVNEKTPVPSKAGNGERNSPKEQSKEECSKSSPKASFVHSDGSGLNKGEKEKEEKEVPCNDNGGGNYDKTSSKNEVSAKNSDEIEMDERAADDECADDDGEAMELSQKKRSRKPLSVEKSPKVMSTVRGKKNSEKSDETDSPNVSVPLPSAVELTPEKPVEKKRGSRKSSTPKKALDSISATAIVMPEPKELEEKVKLESEENPEPVGELRADIKPSSIELEQNGDHLHRPQSTSPAEDNSSRVKIEAASDKVQSKDEKSPEDCEGKESKSDLKQSTDVAAVRGIVKSEVTLGKCDQSLTTSKVLESSESNSATLPVNAGEKENVSKKSMEASGDVVTEGTPQPDGESTAKRKRRQRNGLVDGLDISMVLDAGSDGGNNPPVRQSRRIAMQKIKEETNRRQIEDEMLKKMKADAVRKKKDLGMHISDDEYRRTESTPEQSDSSSSDGGVGVDGRRRKKKKKKKKGNLQQQLQQQQLLQAQLLKKQTTWNSATSPESSSETEAEDYFAEPYHSEEDVRRSNAVLKSDHEFSPESDLETEAPAQPLKRARTARKARRKREVTAASDEDDEDDDDEDDGEDHACQQCKKTDQPEWILLCDTCDKGYHCACLKPVLFTIPEGDWFCPVCQHRQLIERLQSKLVLYDALQAKLAAEAKRREEEEQCAREAELAEQALEKEREEQLRAQKRARQQQRLLERGGNGRQRSGSRSPSLDSSRERRRRRQRQRNRRGSKRRRSSRSRSGDGDGSRSSGSDDDSGSRRGSGSDGSGSCTDSDDMPIYKHLRRRASTKVSYKFNEYDSLIDSAIRREMRDCEIPMDVDRDEEDEDDDGGHGFSKGKDISTIIEATTRDEEARKRALQIVDEDTEEEEDKGTAADQVVNGSSQDRAENDDTRPTSLAPEAGGEVKNTATAVVRQDRAPKPAVANKKARKKKKKLCKIELSSEEEEDDSDEDFRGEVSGSDDDEEEDDDDEDEDENSLSGESESSLDLGHHRRRNDRSRQPSSRAAAKKRRRIVENSDDSEDEEEERRKEIAKKNRKNRRMLDDSDEELDLEDDDEEDSEDYDSDDLCSDTETESSRRSSDSGSNGTSSSSSSASTEGDWRRKKKKKTKGGGKSKAKSTPSSGGGLGSGKHIERPKKTPAAKTMDSSGVEEEDSADSDSAGKGGKTMPRKSSKKSATPRSSESGGKKETTGGGGEKKSDRKTRGKKIHYIVDDDFESSDDGIRPGVQRPDTPPEEREQFIRRQEEIKRMLAENNAAKAKELATSRIDQLVGGRSGGSKDSSAKDSLSDVPMQVIESARILDIDFLKSTSGNTARISTVDSVVDFDDELPEDFDPDDEMDDEALAKIMEEEDFAHHQLKAPGVGVPPPPSSADLLPPILSVPPVAKTNRRKSIPDPSEVLLSQRARHTTDPSAVATVGRKDQHPSSLGPVNLAAPSSIPPPPHVQSPVKALLKPTGIPTSTIMPPMIGAPPGSGGSSTILANALQTSAPHAAHHHHPPTLPPPPLLKETPHPGRPSDVLMRSLTGQPHPVPPGSLHHKPSELSHLMAGLGGSGIPLPLAKGGVTGGVPMPSLPPHSHHSGHRLPPVGLGMPPTGLGLLGHGPPPHAPQPGLHTPTKLPPGGPPTTAGVVPHSASTVAAAVAAASAAAAAAIGAAGGSASALGGPTAAGTVTAGTPTLTVPGAERRPGRRKKITPLREDLKRRANVPPTGPSGSQPPPPPPGGANEQLPSAVPSAAHQEQHQRPPPQHASQHHGHMVRFPPTHAPPPVLAAASPVGLRHPLPPATSIHSSTAHQSATAMAAAAAAAAAAQELAIKVHSRPADGGGASAGGPGILVNDPPLSVPSSVAHLSYLSENPLFAHRLGPLPSSILSSGSSSLQRIAAISGAAGPPTVYGDPTAYNGGWKPPPPGSSKMKSTGSSQPPPHPPGMMVGPPSIGSLEHYHEYNPANHYNPYYNVLDRAHLRPPPTIGELHRTSTLSPTTFTTLQPLEFQHVLKTSGDNHHHHHSATSSPASTAGDDVGGGRGSAGSVERLPPSHHGAGGGGATGPPPPPHPPSVPAASDSTQHPSLVETSSPPPAAPAATASTAPASLMPPSAGPAAASTTASTSSSTSTSVFGELVSYFSSQQDDLDS